VVIPAWNAGGTIRQCLDSVESQVLPPFEIIIVDDGSEDNTAAIAGKYGVRVLNTGGRRGPAAARNLGAEAATGDVLLFLDSDVTIPPELTTRLSSCFHDDSVWAYQTLYSPLCPASDPVSMYQNYYYYYSLNRMPQGNTATFATWCSAVRRSRFHEIGGFNVRIPEPTVEDEELGYTIADRNGVIFLDKSLHVTHLASYTLTQFTRRRLRMARAQAKSGWRQVRNRLLARYIGVRDSGTHHSRWVVLSIVLMLAFQASIVSAAVSASLPLLITAGASLVSALLCHTAFLRRTVLDIGKEVLLPFSLLCMYDMAVLGWGIAAGTLQYALGQKY